MQAALTYGDGSAAAHVGRGVWLVNYLAVLAGWRRKGWRGDGIEWWDVTGKGRAGRRNWST